MCDKLIEVDNPAYARDQIIIIFGSQLRGITQIIRQRIKILYYIIKYLQIEYN